MSDSVVTVDLGPTRGQLVRAFVWVVLGIIVGGVFIWLATTGGRVQPGSVAIGGGIIVLALISSVLEYLALPGASVRVDAEQVLIQPRRGDATVLPTASLAALCVDYVPTPRRSIVRRHSGAPARAPGWWLVTEPRPGVHEDLPGMNRAFPIGVDEQRLADLRAALATHRIALTSEV